MKALILKQVIIGALFAVLIPFTTWWGFSVVYERPDYSVAYKSFEKEYADKIAEIESKNKRFSYKKIDKLWSGSKQKASYQKGIKHYERISFYVFIFVALIAFVAGSLLAMPLIGSGFLLAGMFCVVSSGAFFNDLGLVRALSLLFILLLLIFFSHKNLHRK